MTPTIQDKLVFRQQSYLVKAGNRLVLMRNQTLAYIQRLNELCDELKIPPGRGRQTALAKMFKQKQQTVNLWFKGETEPTLDTARAMALKAKFQIDWLVTGREPKYLEKQRLRPSIAGLVKAAESLPDYKVEQLTKIVPAIAESNPPGNDGGEEGQTPLRKKIRPL